MKTHKNNGWIKFSEKKPEEGQSILFLTEADPFLYSTLLDTTFDKINHGIYSDEFTPHLNGAVETETNIVKTENINWWMPAPMLPKKD